MTTTLTATPEPGAAAIRLQVTTTDTPTVVLDLDRDELAAEIGSWTQSGTGTLGVSDPNGIEASWAHPHDGYITRNLTGLVVGQVYRVDATVVRAFRATSMVVPTLATHIIPAGSAGFGPVVESFQFTATATSHQLRLYPYAREEGEMATIFTSALRALKLTQIPPAYQFSLTRTDANGTRAVRMREGDGIVGGALLVTDYEAALSGPVSYTVTTTEAVTTTTSLDVAQTWLTVPVVPTYSYPVDLVTGYEANSEPTTTVHLIIGRADPILSLGVMRMRSGRLDLWCASYDDAEAIVGVYSRGQVVMLRQPDHPGLDMYHAATGAVRVTPHPENTPTRRWAVEVSYTEVKAPSAPLAGALGWTYAQATAAYPTYGDSMAAFPTYGDLYIGLGPGYFTLLSSLVLLGW